jgi:hypothetical protein
MQANPFFTSGLVEILLDDMKIIMPYGGKAIHKIAIPPDAVHVYTQPPAQPLLNCFAGIVEDIKQNNSMVKLRISVGKSSLISELPLSLFERKPVGKKAKILWDNKDRALKVYCLLLKNVVYKFYVRFFPPLLFF